MGGNQGAMKKSNRKPRTEGAGAPWKGIPPRRPAPMASGTRRPNRMRAWVRSRVPAIRPPAAIGRNAPGLPECVPESVADETFASGRAVESPLMRRLDAGGGEGKGAEGLTGDE